MTYDARAVANYVLDRVGEKDFSLTQMALLKIVYFCHAWVLVEKNVPLVLQNFEAWKFGPVVRVIYDQTKTFGKKPIEGRLKKINLDTGEDIVAYCDVDRSIRKIVDNVIDSLCTYDGLRLSDLTHEKGSPWDVVWHSASTCAIPGMVIKNELIQKWFAETGGAAAYRIKETSFDETSDSSGSCPRSSPNRFH